MTQNERLNPSAQVSKKKPYSTPKIVLFGDFQNLTMGGGGIKVNDGGPTGRATRP